MFNISLDGLGMSERDYLHFCLTNLRWQGWAYQRLYVTTSSSYALGYILTVETLGPI